MSSGKGLIWIEAGLYLAPFSYFIYENISIEFYRSGIQLHWKYPAYMNF